MMFLSRALIAATARGELLPQYNSFDFNGSTQYINCGNDSSLQITGNITVCAWVLFDSVPTSSKGILSKYTTVSDQRSWLLYRTSSEWRLLISPDGTNGFTISSSSSSVSASQWYHIAGVYDGSTIKLYLDGVEVDSTSYTGGVYNSSTNVLIGDYQGVAFIDGSVTQPMIFDSALSASDIAEIYNNGIPLGYDKISTSITNNCVLAYEMSSNDDTLNDLSTNTNNGTINGGATANGQLITWKH